MSFEDTIVGFVGGFLISLLTFYVGMQVQRRAERKNFLRKHIRQFYPILRGLAMDLGYAVSLKLKDNSDLKSLADVSSKISMELESFSAAYLKLRESGLEPELESCDRDAANELKGLYTMLKMENPLALMSNLDRYHNKVIVCRNLVESYLKGKWWQF
jgi:hypothetical protein